MFREEWEARRERQDMIPTMEEREDGTFIVKKLGCVGVGPSLIEAIHDLHRKVELAHGPPMTEAQREKDDKGEAEFANIYKALGEYERKQKS